MDNSNPSLAREERILAKAREWAKKYDITIVIPRSPNAPQDGGHVRLVQLKDRNPGGLVCIDYMSMLKEVKDGTVQPNPLDGDEEQ